MRTLLPVAVISVTILCARFACAQTSEVTEAQAQEFANRMVRQHIAWETKVSTPGASIRAEKASQEGSRVSYRLYVSGLPSDGVYTVLSWPVGQAKPSTMIEGATLGPDGIVMCAGRAPEQCGDASKKDDPIDFVLDPVKGEPFRFALVAGDYRATSVVVPDPITGRDKGCALTVERLLPHFELAFFSGSGFPPNTAIKFETQSYEEKHEITSKSDEAGSLTFAILPAVSGHSRGATTVKATGTCAPSLKFEWGS